MCNKLVFCGLTAESGTVPIKWKQIVRLRNNIPQFFRRDGKFGLLGRQKW
jgi:hypothetical protein